MVTWIGVLALAAMPFVVVVGLFAVAAWRDRSRAAVVERQIRLTDAITGELGAVVAPVVRRRLGGRLEVQMAVPVRQPATVGRVVAIAHAVLTVADGGGDRYEIVLTPQDGDGRPEVTRVVTPRLRAA
jgi:hypothetical protein